MSRRFPAAWLILILFLLPRPAIAAGVGELSDRLGNSALEVSSNPTAFERFHLTETDRLDLKMMGIQSEGRAVHVYDCGLDIYADTPDFDNFTKLIGKYLGGGTCLGMCEIVKNAYERSNFDRSGRLATHELARLMAGIPTTLHGYGDLRSLTAAEANRVRTAMEAAHLDNLRPESWLPWLRDSIHNIPDRSTYEAVRNRIRFGRAVKISIQSSLPIKMQKIGPIGIPLPDKDNFHGHALLAYKIIEFAGEGIVFVYDPNYHYGRDHANVATGLRFDKASGTLELFPGAYKDRYSWTENILCIDGLTGPWLAQLQHALSGFLQEAGERIRDALETVGHAAEAGWDEVKDGAGRVRDRVVDGGHAVLSTRNRGVKQLRKWWGGLF